MVYYININRPYRGVIRNRNVNIINKRGLKATKEKRSVAMVFQIPPYHFYIKIKRKWTLTQLNLISKVFSDRHGIEKWQFI